MEKKHWIIFLYCLLFISCGEKKVYGEKTNLSIHRFDKDLQSFLTGNTSQEELTAEYNDFLDLYGEEVIGIGRQDSAGFFLRLNQFFSHPDLKQLYADELKTFEDLSKTEEQLSDGFSFLQASFDSIAIPTLCIHVSGLNQNIIVSEQFISIAADKYLGAEYPLYTNFFYDYQRQSMIPERLASDYLLGFLLSTFTPPATNSSLLDRMLYEGKLRYLLALALPEHSEAEIMAYTEQQENWCRENKANVWKMIIQEKHLFSNDQLLIDRYVNEAPYTSPISDQSPGRLGVWVGYQIIKAYMKESRNESLQSLMNHTDSQEILKTSKYKP